MCIYGNVLEDRAMVWLRFSAVLLLTAAPRLYASDAPATSEDYKLVPVKRNGTTTYIKVRKEADPFRNLPASPGEKYDPQRIFSTTSPYADKTFSDPALPDIKKSALSDRSYDTKPFEPGQTSTASADTTFSGRSSATDTRQAAEFEKSVASAKFDTGPNASVTTTASTDQDRTADVPSRKQDLFASTMADKQYLGPGAQDVPKGINIKENVVIAHLSDLPNRPLTIDEVRDLINHGFAPDTSAPPPPESKPLNDPDYKPEPQRDMPAAAAASEDDKNDPVPPPGMLNQPPPENSEPLPQH